jgi:hypothetical protein
MWLLSLFFISFVTSSDAPDLLRRESDKAVFVIESESSKGFKLVGFDGKDIVRLNAKSTSKGWSPTDFTEITLNHVIFLPVDKTVIRNISTTLQVNKLPNIRYTLLCFIITNYGIDRIQLFPELALLFQNLNIDIPKFYIGEVVRFESYTAFVCEVHSGTVKLWRPKPQTIIEFKESESVIVPLQYLVRFADYFHIDAKEMIYEDENFMFECNPDTKVKLKRFQEPKKFKLPFLIEDKPVFGLIDYISYPRKVDPETVKLYQDMKNQHFSVGEIVYILTYGGPGVIIENEEPCKVRIFDIEAKKFTDLGMINYGIRKYHTAPVKSPLTDKGADDYINLVERMINTHSDYLKPNSQGYWKIKVICETAKYFMGESVVNQIIKKIPDVNRIVKHMKSFK